MAERSGRRDPCGVVVAGRHARRVSQEGDIPAKAVGKDLEPKPQYELTLTSGGPSFSPVGDRYAFVGAAVNAKGAGVMVSDVGSDTSRVMYRDPARNALGPQWSPNGDRIIFGIGIFDAFFNGFHGQFPATGRSRGRRSAVAIVNADGSGFRELTTGPNNSGFPSMSPDGRRFVYEPLVRTAMACGSWTSRPGR
jgi:Tol biopolymer transport system component